MNSDWSHKYPNTWRARTRRGASLILGLIGAIAFTIAQPSKAETLLDLDLPAGSLRDSLITLADDNGYEIVYETELAEGLKADPIDGQYTLEQALKKLLTGSGIEFRVRSEKTIILSRLQSTSLTTESLLAGVGEFVLAAAEPDQELSDGPIEQEDLMVRGAPLSGYTVLNANTATKTDTPLLETPANIQVIPKSVLDDQQVINLNDAMRNVAGATFNQGAGGLDNIILLRGFENPAYYRNGYRFLDLGGGAVGTRQMANVERVEVLKGPGAVLYGQTQPGGLVNVVTKRPLKTPYYALQQQFGSFDLYRSTVDLTGPLTEDDTVLYRFNASFEDSGSFREFVDSERFFLAPIMTWNISERTQATLEMEYRHDNLVYDNQIRPFIDGQFVDIPRERNLAGRTPTDVEGIFIGFDWSHEFNDDWKLSQKFVRDYIDVKSDFVFGVGSNLTDGRLLNRTMNKGITSTTVYFTDTNLTGHFDTFGLKHTLLLGGDYYHHERPFAPLIGLTIAPIDVFNPVHTGPTTQGNRIHGSDTLAYWGLYAQDQIKLPHGLHVVGGLRYQNLWQKGFSTTSTGAISSQTNLTVDDVVPNVGVLWQAQDWLSLYGNYVESFGTANTSIDFFGNQLPPESAQQWEVGLKTEFFDGRLSATLSYYDLTKQNLATPDPDPTHIICPGGGACFVAAGEVRSRGPELDIRGEILPGWNAILTYANLDVRVTKDNDPAKVGNRLFSVPRNIGSLWTTYDFQQQPLRGLKLGGGVTMRDGSIVGNNIGLESAGFATVDLLAAYSLKLGKSRLTAQLNVNNLMDKEYLTDTGFGSGPGTRVTYGTPRSFIGSIRLEY